MQDLDENNRMMQREFARGGLWCWLWTYQTEAESDGSLTSKPLPRGRGGGSRELFCFHIFERSQFNKISKTAYALSSKR